jgi:hypothetical protein
VLVCVLAFWRQVDYYCKLMQPWQELRKGQVDAERSILLNYLSPMHTTSLVQAVRHRHAPIAASISGFIVLKANILLSTGVLVLTPVESTGPQPFTLNTRFSKSPRTSLATLQQQYYYLLQLASVALTTRQPSFCPTCA